MTVRVGTHPIQTLTLRLAEPLVVQSVVSKEWGRLFNMRAKGQSSLIVSLPVTLAPGSRVTLTITYAGRLDPQEIDAETAAAQSVGAGRLDSDFVDAARAEFSLQQPKQLVSARPGGPLRHRYAAHHDSGRLFAASRAASCSPPRPRSCRPGSPPRRRRPTSSPRTGRCVISHSSSAAWRRFAAPPAGPLRLVGAGQPGPSDPRPRRRRPRRRHRAVLSSRFSTTLRTRASRSRSLESDLPGGHSPGYFAVLNDPASPMRLLLGPERPGVVQGLSGLCARARARPPVVGSGGRLARLSRAVVERRLFAVFRRAVRTAASAAVGCSARCCARCVSGRSPAPTPGRFRSATGSARSRATAATLPGGRLQQERDRAAHAAAAGRRRRVFRGTAPLLPRLALPERLGRSTSRWRWKRETGRPLDRFFSRWIDGATLPRISFSYRVDAGDVVLRLEQIGDLFDLPVTVTLQYADRQTTDVVVPVTDRVVEMRVPLSRRAPRRRYQQRRPAAG